MISEQERLACAPLLTAAASRRRGARDHRRAGRHECSAAGGEDRPACRLPRSLAPRDDLGAGDVFAAAFFVALHEGLSPVSAATFANAAAAIRVEGVGADAIGDRRAIEARMP